MISEARYTQGKQYVSIIPKSTPAAMDSTCFQQKTARGIQDTAIAYTCSDTICSCHYTALIAKVHNIITHLYYQTSR